MRLSALQSLLDGTVVIMLLAWFRIKQKFNSEIDDYLEANPNRHVVFLILLSYLLSMYLYVFVITLLVIMTLYIFKIIVLQQFARMANGVYPISVENILKRLTLFVTSKKHIFFHVAVFSVLLVFVYICSVLIIQQDSTSKKQQMNWTLNGVLGIFIMMYLAWCLHQTI